MISSIPTQNNKKESLISALASKKWLNLKNNGTFIIISAFINFLFNNFLDATYLGQKLGEKLLLFWENSRHFLLIFPDLSLPPWQLFSALSGSALKKSLFDFNFFPISEFLVLSSYRYENHFPMLVRLFWVFANMINIP